MHNQKVWNNLIKASAVADLVVVVVVVQAILFNKEASAILLIALYVLHLMKFQMTQLRSGANTINRQPT